MAFTLSQFRLVMFDLDGTLVDSAPDIHAALLLALRECGYADVEEQQTRCWVGNGARVLVNRALQGCLEVSAEHPDLDRVYEAFLRHYAVENGKRSVLYAGVDKLFLRLKSQGCQLAVVTNKPFQLAKHLLEQLGLNCDLLLGGDSLDRRKPDPLPLLHCMSHFKCEKTDAVLVGDSVNDFQAAAAAGVACVGVSYGYNHGLPIDPRNLAACVDSLLELG